MLDTLTALFEQFKAELEQLMAWLNDIFGIKQL